MTDSDDTTAIRMMMKRLEDIGAARVMIDDMLNNILQGQNFGLFDDLSKHASFWQCADEETADKLHDVRCSLIGLHTQLYELKALLNPEDKD